MQNYLRTLLRGVGQVMLQNNAATGALFLIGIFYNSWVLGLGAVFGNVVSTASAVLFKYKQEDIENGLFGFNGTLVGIATWFFFGVSITTSIAILLGAILSTLIMQQMKQKMPAFTAPFVIATWVVIFGITALKLAPMLGGSGVDYYSFLDAVGKGFGQVMFQGSTITGALFFVGILVNSRIAAAYALYGSVLGAVLAVVFKFPLPMIYIGLFGYNAVLCAIALGEKKWNAFILATLAVILSVFIQIGFTKISIISLTAPFVLATWCLLIVKKIAYAQK